MVNHECASKGSKRRAWRVAREEQRRGVRPRWRCLYVCSTCRKRCISLSISSGRCPLIRYTPPLPMPQLPMLRSPTSPVISTLLPHVFNLMQSSCPHDRLNKEIKNLPRPRMRNRAATVLRKLAWRRPKVMQAL